MARVLAEGLAFGRAAPTGKKVQVEFVSANPTGPLHVGHGRGAAYGASLSNLLAFCGDEVQREFYINDAGRQMDILAASVWLRYLESLGASVTFPEDGYRADYVRAIASDLAKTHGKRFERDTATLPQATSAEDADAALDALINHAKAVLAADWREVHRFALDAMLADQRDDLGAFAVVYARWLSDPALQARVIGIYDKGGLPTVLPPPGPLDTVVFPLANDNVGGYADLGVPASTLLRAAPGSGSTRYGSAYDGADMRTRGSEVQVGNLQQDGESLRDVGLSASSGSRPMQASQLEQEQFPF